MGFRRVSETRNDQLHAARVSRRDHVVVYPKTDRSCGALFSQQISPVPSPLSPVPTWYRVSESESESESDTDFYSN